MLYTEACQPLTACCINLRRSVSLVNIALNLLFFLTVCILCGFETILKLKMSRIKVYGDEEILRSFTIMIFLFHGMGANFI